MRHFKLKPGVSYAVLPHPVTKKPTRIFPGVVLSEEWAGTPHIVEIPVEAPPVISTLPVITPPVAPVAVEVLEVPDVQPPEDAPVLPVQEDSKSLAEKVLKGKKKRTTESQG